MDIEEKLKIIKRNTVEIINENKLKEVLSKKKPVTYCGYESSGEIHLGHLVTINKLLDLQKAGFHIKVLFADWHTWLNRKGDWDFINKEVKSWKKGFKAAGLKDAEFILGTSFQRKLDYIEDILSMTLKITINRALRSMQQVARDIENARVSQVIYPLMQIEDIKSLKVDVVTAGIEQRKIHMLGVEILPDLGYTVPVFVHTPLISSLRGEGKMSSSDPMSMISIRDDEEIIRKKVNRAYCVEGIVEKNSILEILKLIVFPRIESFIIRREKKFGENIKFSSYEEVEKYFLEKKIHPMDLKNAVADELAKIIEPIRKKFSQ